MKKIVLSICLILLCNFVSYKLEASFYRDKIFIGKNKEQYKYFFTATEYTKESDMLDKINRKIFPFKKEINLLIVAEMPSSLSYLEQESMWDKLKVVNSVIKEISYKKNVKFNGYFDKTTSTYKIHVYYR